MLINISEYLLFAWVNLGLLLCFYISAGGESPFRWMEYFLRFQLDFFSNVGTFVFIVFISISSDFGRQSKFSMLFVLFRFQANSSVEIIDQVSFWIMNLKWTIKWIIHVTKRQRENQLLNMKHSCSLTLVQNVNLKSGSPWQSSVNHLFKDKVSIDIAIYR